MYISDFRLVDILRDKMGEEEARTLVEYIESKVEDKYLEAKNVFATKEDLLRLELKILESIHKNTQETQKQIGECQKQIGECQKQVADCQKQISDSKVEVIKLISDSKSEMIRWLFGLIIGTTIAVISTILTVMKMGGW
ncbi:MAG: hypothetical protein ACKVOU_11870 [Cytophagales bacterium]